GSSAPAVHLPPPSRTDLLPRRAVDQVGGEIRRLQLEVAAVALAGEGAGDGDVVLDPLLGQAEDALGALELGVEVRVDHLLLARQARQRLRFAQPLDRLLPDDGPVALAGPAGGGERPGIAVGDADLVDMLAEADIGSPARQLAAARHINRRHCALSSTASRIPAPHSARRDAPIWLLAICVTVCNPACRAPRSTLGGYHRKEHSGDDAAMGFDAGGAGARPRAGARRTGLGDRLR